MTSNLSQTGIWTLTTDLQKNINKKIQHKQKIQQISLQMHFQVVMVQGYLTSVSPSSAQVERSVCLMPAACLLHGVCCHWQSLCAPLMFLLPGLWEEAEVSGRTHEHLFLGDVQVVSITEVQGQFRKGRLQAMRKVRQFPSYSLPLHH